MIICKKRIYRIFLVTIGILLVPLIAMQFSDEVDWKAADFIVIGTLLLGTGFAYELVAAKVKNPVHRTIAGVFLLALLLLVWADLAVGVFNIPGFSGS